VRGTYRGRAESLPTHRKYQGRGDTSTPAPLSRLLSSRCGWLVGERRVPRESRVLANISSPANPARRQDGGRQPQHRDNHCGASSQICATVPRRARIQGSCNFVSLNSRLESYKEEEDNHCGASKTSTLKSERRGIRCRANTGVPLS